MNERDIRREVALGCDSSRHFTEDIRNAESLAAEMAAFANTSGGIVYIGVGDDGSVKGLDYADVARIHQLIGTAASELVRSPLTVRTENVPLDTGRVVIVVTVPDGLDKPYFDTNGVIWCKMGADTRRITSKEELRRFFQMTGQFFSDELSTKVSLDALDSLRFRDFLKKTYQMDIPETRPELHGLLENLHLATHDCHLNLAGVLLFAEHPEWFAPEFIVKAIRYPGNTIHATRYIDTEDFCGPLKAIFDGAYAFIVRNLHKIQAGQGVNAQGQPEIPPSVFEELLVNALVHRDYTIRASIRLFIFDNRIEIISPGHLPNNLTLEKIKNGATIIRNPILSSFVAKGLLPYHGLGTGIARVMKLWPDVDFFDDRDACLFTVIVRRPPLCVEL